MHPPVDIVGTASPPCVSGKRKGRTIQYPWYQVQYLIFLCLTPLHHYTITPLHHYTITPLHHYTITPLHHHTITPLHHYTITPLHHYTITPSHHYTITPLHHSRLRRKLGLYISRDRSGRPVPRQPARFPH